MEYTVNDKGHVVVEGIETENTELEFLKLQNAALEAENAELNSAVKTAPTKPPTKPALVASIVKGLSETHDTITYGMVVQGCADHGYFNTHEIFTIFKGDCERAPYYMPGKILTLGGVREKDSYNFKP